MPAKTATMSTSTHQSSPSPQLPITQLPEYFHLVDINHLTHLIADMLARLTTHNDQIPLTSNNLTRFHSRAPPAISITDYLCRIVKYASIERVCLLILLIYIDRMCERNRSFTISSLTVHRFIITGITCATKALCDSYLTNTMYAKVGGISTKELNVLEVEFLFLIDWHLASNVETLQDYYVNLIRQHPQYTRAINTGSKPYSYEPITPTSTPTASPIPCTTQNNSFSPEFSHHNSTHHQQSSQQRSYLRTPQQPQSASHSYPPHPGAHPSHHPNRAPYPPYPRRVSPTTTHPNQYQQQQPQQQQQRQQPTPPSNHSDVALAGLVAMDTEDVIYYDSSSPISVVKSAAGHASRGRGRGSEIEWVD